MKIAGAILAVIGTLLIVSTWLAKEPNPPTLWLGVGLMIVGNLFTFLPSDDSTQSTAGQEED
jgi:drug/metabolite transporter (DMT)-like permease